MCSERVLFKLNIEGFGRSMMGLTKLAKAALASGEDATWTMPSLGMLDARSDRTSATVRVVLRPYHPTSTYRHPKGGDHLMTSAVGARQSTSGIQGKAFVYFWSITNDSRRRAELSGWYLRSLSFPYTILMLL